MSTLIDSVEEKVSILFNTNLDRKYLYHNLAHTERVVKNTKELIKNLEIEDISAENLETADRFHDAGLIKQAENHEEESVKITVDFLQKENVAKDRVEIISNLIWSTKMDHEPKDDLEKSIADADCAYLASKNFFDYTFLSRKEW